MPRFLIRARRHVTTLRRVLPNPTHPVRQQWTFLRDGKSKGVPISPFLDVPAVVIKDKNEEVCMRV